MYIFIQITNIFLASAIFISFLIISAFRSFFIQSSVDEWGTHETKIINGIAILQDCGEIR